MNYLLRDGEINFEQVNLTSGQIYQINLKSNLQKPGLDIKSHKLSMLQWYLKPWD